MSDTTYIVQVTFSISVAGSSDEDAERGAVDRIHDMFARDGYAIRDLPDIGVEIIGEV